MDTKIPNISQLKIEKLFWFPKYGRDLTSTCYCWGPRWCSTTVSHNLTTTWSTNIVIDFFLCLWSCRSPFGCSAIVTCAACVLFVVRCTFLSTFISDEYECLVGVWKEWITCVIDVEKQYSPRRKSEQRSTKIYHRLLVHCHSVKVCLFQKHPSFSLPYDEEEEMFLKKHFGHLLWDLEFLFNIHWTTDISDLIRDLKMLKNKAELLLSILNSGIFWKTLRKRQHFAPAKRYPLLCNVRFTQWS
jgi:hypothetical protein